MRVRLQGVHAFAQDTRLVRDGCQGETLSVHELLQGKEVLTPPGTCLPHA